MASIPKILISIALFATIIVAITIPFYDMTNNYGVSVSSDLNTTLEGFGDDFDNISGLSTGIHDSALQTEASQTTDTGFNLKDAVSALKLIPESFNIVKTMVNRIAFKIGIPGVWITFFILSIIITVTFLIISALMKNPL